MPAEVMRFAALETQHERISRWLRIVARDWRDLVAPDARVIANLPTLKAEIDRFSMEVT